MLFRALTEQRGNVFKYSLDRLLIVFCFYLSISGILIMNASVGVLYEKKKNNFGFQYITDEWTVKWNQARPCLLNYTFE